MLSREFKALAANGLIDRKDFATVAPKVEYRLTRKGQSFFPVVDAIRGLPEVVVAAHSDKLQIAFGI
jgi:DNA-binding HxlR family transcriptional regulator